MDNQQLLEKHLLNANALQMLSGQCSHVKFLEEHQHFFLSTILQTHIGSVNHTGRS